MEATILPLVLCPQSPPRAVVSPLSDPEEIFFFDSTGALSRDRLAGWGPGSPGAGLPASPVILVQSNWSIPQSFQAPHPAAGGRGALGLKAAALATLAQTLPAPIRPKQPGPKARPARAVPCALADRVLRRDRNVEGTLGAKMATPAKLNPAS